MGGRSTRLFILLAPRINPVSNQSQSLCSAVLLSQGAMYISQAKGYKDGMSAIISSSDFNFWDDIALKSYAEVVSKRHSQLGINFEEVMLARALLQQLFAVSSSKTAMLQLRSRHRTWRSIRMLLLKAWK